MPARKSDREAVSRLSMTVLEFCASVGISKSTYEKLKRAGQHPREMQICRAVRISQRAAQEWIKAREGDRDTAA